MEMANQIPSWARIGAKVVCVEDLSAIEVESTPLKGNVYTIRQIDVGFSDVGLIFKEIVNQPKEYIEGFAEPSFWVNYFRPVQTKTIEQDVAIFAPLLETKSEKELVDV